MVCASLDQRGVVAAGDGAVQGRADALVGLRAGDHQPADAALGQHRLEVGVLEGVGEPLVHQRLGLAPRSSGTYCQPSLPAACRRVVLHPDDVDAGGARLVDEGGDVGDDGVAVVGIAHDAVLDVDHEQGGVGTVRREWSSVPPGSCAVPVCLL